MRYLVIVISLALLLPFLFCSISQVNATEFQTDWADPSYWENLNFDTLSTETWENALVWLEAEADLPLLILIEQHADGFFGSDVGGILAKRFLSHPEDILYTLANEEPNTQKKLISSIIYGASNWEAMAGKLETVTLSGPDAEKGYKILSEMIAYAEETYRTEITNPKTGDPVGVAVALLALSGIGGGLMIWKKKSSRYAA